jgi:hypothetical protein
MGLVQTYQFLNKNHAHPLTYAAIGGSLVLATVFGGRAVWNSPGGR